MQDKSNKENFTNLPLSIKNIFSKEDVSKILILKRLTLRWKDIVGEILGDFTQPKDFTNDTLIIQSTHSAYSQDIHFHSKNILDAFHSISEKRTVNKVFCKLGNINKAKKKQQIKKEKTFEGKDELIACLSKIDDAELKKKFLDLIKVMD